MGCKENEMEGVNMPESGGTPESRMQEAAKIIDRLNKVNEQLTEKELNFVGSMEDAIERPKGSVSPNQLFWLRDILEKYNA